MTKKYFGRANVQGPSPVPAGDIQNECPGIKILKTESAEYDVTLPAGGNSAALPAQPLRLRDYMFVLRNDSPVPLIVVSFSSNNPAIRSKTIRSINYYSNPLQPGQERMEFIRGIKLQDRVSLSMALFADSSFEGDPAIAQQFNERLQGEREKAAAELENLKSLAQLSDDQMLAGVRSMRQRLTEELKQYPMVSQVAQAGDEREARLTAGRKTVIELYIPMLTTLQQHLETGNHRQARSHLNSLILTMDNRYSHLR